MTGPADAHAQRSEMTDSPFDERGGILTPMFNQIHMFRILEHMEKLNILRRSDLHDHLEGFDIPPDQKEFQI